MCFNSEFIKEPFRDWKNATGALRGCLNRHNASLNHLQCVEKAANFLAVMDKNRLSIKSQLSNEYEKQVQVNTRALLAIIDVIQFLANQGIALRGHHWNKVTHRENGNFSTMIDFLANYSTELRSHILRSPKNARYLSPKIQNEFISINGDLIRKNIVKECNEALFWSVMVDEATDISTKERVSVCIRYVCVKNGELEVCEEFIGFCALSATDAETITRTIVDFMQNCGLNMQKWLERDLMGPLT